MPLAVANCTWMKSKAMQTMLIDYVAESIAAGGRQFE
jgi:hypothetical protein